MDQSHSISSVKYWYSDVQWAAWNVWSKTIVSNATKKKNECQQMQNTQKYDGNKNTNKIRANGVLRMNEG